MNLEEVKDTLQDEIEESGDFKDALLVVELELLQDTTGIIRGEFIEEGEKEATGSVVVPLKGDEKPDAWKNMEIEEQKAYGFLLNSRKETWSEKFANFFQRSVDDGQLQDFVPGTGLSS